MFSIFLLLAFASGLSAQQNDFQVAETINTFGINLFKELSKTNKNLVFSGYSISAVLNMLLVGSRGNTEKEIRDALGYNSAGLTKTRVERAYDRYIKEQRSKKNGYDLDVANSIWIREGMNVLPEFKSKITKTFQAEEKEVDFSSPLATDQINSWVKNETKDNIQILFDKPLDSSTAMVLINTMYFKGTWVTKFDENFTKKSPFTYSKYWKQDIPMMNLVSKFPYYESKDLDAQILELPYNGDEVSMIVVLPKSGHNLTPLHQKLANHNLKTAISRLQEEKVHVKIPKFESATILSLNDALKFLGIKEAFSFEADLSGIAGSKGLFVSNAIQNTVIEVSEKGTVAAAASGIEIHYKSMPDPPPREFFFTADHPFLYFIIHKPTGLLLFMGNKSNP